LDKVGALLFQISQSFGEKLVDILLFGDIIIHIFDEHFLGPEGLILEEVVPFPLHFLDFLATFLDDCQILAFVLPFGLSFTGFLTEEQFNFCDRVIGS
jgi:hypothetical protein